MGYWGDEDLEVWVEEGATPTYVKSSRRAFIGESEPDMQHGDLWFDPDEAVALTRAAGDVTFSDSGLAIITGVSNVQAALAMVDAKFEEQDAAWTSYTPTWTGSTSNPTLGDGTLVGTYRVSGKTLWFRLYLAAGSTTTFGSGNYGFSTNLPVTFKTGINQVAAASIEDNAPSVNRYPTTALLTGGTNTIARILTSSGGAGASNTSPFTWAASDKIIINGCVEVD
jgi:hypothetical protein